MGEFLFKEDKIANNINNPIKLSQKQKYWINKFIDMINSINVSPKILFNLSIKDSNKNIAKIIELMRQIRGGIGAVRIGTVAGLGFLPLEHIGLFGLALGSHQLAALFQQHFLKKLEIGIAHSCGFLFGHNMNSF